MAAIDAFRPVEDRDLTRHEVGPETLRWVPFDAVTQLPQQRTEIDQEALDRLKTSLGVVSGDRLKIDFMHPPTVNIIPSRTKARQYVRELNDCWRLDHPVTAVKPYEVHGERTYPAQVAGHRRMLAIGQMLPELDYVSGDTDVMSSVHESLSFAQALDYQYRENEHQGLTPWQDARAIATRLRMGLASGEFKTFQDCASAMSVRPERVSQAWRFYQLPEFVQEATRNAKSTRLTYGKSLALYPIAHAVAGSMVFRHRYSSDMASDMAQYLLEEIDSRSLSELQSEFTPEEDEHFNYQVDMHMLAVAKRTNAEAQVYARKNVADIRYESRKAQDMSATDYDALRRAKDLAQLSGTRSQTYVLAADLLNQLSADARTIARMNDDPIEDAPVERIVHTPLARRVLAEVVSELIEMDGILPDEEFIALQSLRRNDLIRALAQVGQEQTVPPEIDIAVSTHLSEEDEGVMNLFESAAS